MKHSVARALDWVGIAATDALLDNLEGYAALLVDEGIPAGVVGPNEQPRIWTRHIADSICFAAPAIGTTWLDVGSGGGLPGLPLAMTHPSVSVTLLDRSGRRCDLVRRWVRVLGLDNVDVIQGEVDRHRTRYDTLLFRASLGLKTACAITTRLARHVGVFGLTHTTGVSVEAHSDESIEVVEIPRRVLDSDAALLRITP